MEILSRGTLTFNVHLKVTDVFRRNHVPDFGGAEMVVVGGVEREILNVPRDYGSWCSGVKQRFVVAVDDGVVVEIPLFDGKEVPV